MRVNGLTGIFGLFLCVRFLTVNVKSETDDAFYCTKTKSEADRTRRKYKARDIPRLRDLEERLADLERRIMETQVPEIITIKSSAIPRDCSEIYRTGVRTDGVFQISPDGRCPFDVFCDMQNGGWTVLQRRKFGNIGFKRKWKEYAEGFGDLDYDFWLGLEKMHRLTQTGSRLLIVLEHYNESLSPEWAEYKGFVIGDVISGYKMNVDTFGYDGTIKESLSYHNGIKFSTIDRDNDMQQASCSKMYGGAGWWFLSCYRLGLLNGIYGTTEKGGISFWDNGDIFVKNTEMKVKPMSGSC